MTWLSVVGAILGLAVPILKWLLERSNASVEQKKAFLAWVEKAGTDYGSVKLKNFAEAQREWMNKNPFQESP